MTKKKRKHRRLQIVMSTKTKVFKELYFTKSAIAKKALFGNRKLSAKEEIQIAPKNRYVTVPATQLKHIYHL